MGRSHMEGPFVIKDGLRIGTKSTNTEVIDSSGNLANGIVNAPALAEEAGFENTLSLYSDSATINVGQPVYITGYSTKGAMSVSLAQANDVTKAAQFVAISASTAVDGAVTVAPVATVTYATTEASGTMLFLGATAAGAIVTTAPALKSHIVQPIGVVVTSGTAGSAKMFPGYSKAVTVAATT